MAKITINGVSYTGDNVSIVGNSVVIDGVTQSNTKGPFEVRVIEGVLNSLNADGSVVCGAVAGSVTAGGSVTCDDVKGDVYAGVSLNCDDVGGNVKAGGSVNCDNVGGNIYR